MNRVELTVEQRTVLEAVLQGVRSGEQVQTLGGYAGTGKSTLVAEMIERLPGFAVCAFTGKAASVLRRKGIGNAQTIHSLIYSAVPLGNGEVDFDLKNKDDLDLRGFIVDEASMVSADVHADLLSFGLPVVFVGDHGQLEPVKSAMNVMEDPMYRLETVHRNAGDVAKFAEHLRKGGEPKDFKGIEGKVKVAAASKLGKMTWDKVDQVICAFNRTRVKLNDNVRAMLGLEGGVQEGERVMCLRNNRRKGLWNGMQGRVSRLRGRRFDLVTDEGQTVPDVGFAPEQFGQEKTLNLDWSGPMPFDWSYCITCHKAQGDEWGRVVVIEERCDLWDFRRWAYTAASRAKEHLTWVVK